MISSFEQHKILLNTTLMHDEYCDFQFLHARLELDVIQKNSASTFLLQILTFPFLSFFCFSYETPYEMRFAPEFPAKNDNREGL